MLKKLFQVGMCLSLSAAVHAASPATISEQFIVKFKPQAESLLSSNEKLSAALGLRIPSNKAMAAQLTIVTVSPSKSFTQIKAILKQLRQSDLVEYAVEDRKSFIKPMAPISTSLGTLPSHDLQWDQLGAPGGVMLESSAGKKDGAWHYSLGESLMPVAVAVIDTGVEPNERLINNFLYDNNGRLVGWNFSANNSNISDETGGYHGTHVAGTIAANGFDNTGMGPKLKILPVKIPDSTGMFYESAVINGIYWAAGADVPGVPENPYPAKVMNMSFGIDLGPGKEVDTCDQVMQDVVDFAISHGSVLVVAAGNNNSEDDLGAPAGCKGTVRVSSTGQTGLRAYYSNYGRGIDYAAPGGDKRLGANGGILSTVQVGRGINGSGLDYKQGTSMASPHVAGLFGLVFAYGQASGITAEQAKGIVYSTTHNFGSNGTEDNSCLGNKACGHGIIDAEQALAAVDANYRFMLNAPKLSQLNLTHEGCTGHKVRAQAKAIENEYGNWQLLNNACVVKQDLDLPSLNTMDFSVTASYGALQYRIYPQGHCERIGIDGVGCS